MKKYYVSPLMKVEKVEIQTFLTEASVGSDHSSGTGGDDDFANKRNSIWGDSREGAKDSRSLW